MRFAHLLPLAAVGAAFVIPDEQVLAELSTANDRVVEKLPSQPKTFLEKLPCSHGLLSGPRAWLYSLKKPKNAVDRALDLQEVENVLLGSDDKFVDGFDAEAWLSHTEEDEPEHPPHHGPPHHGPPHHGPPHHGPPHHGPPHKHPHHGKPEKTIYELIAESKYTTKLAKLISDDKELVKVLNSTKANFTVFAPTDRAFDKIPEHAPKPSKELIKKVLLYHVVPGNYPAGRLLFSHTVPTLLNETLLGDRPQRLVARLGFGVSINFYSKVVAANIRATNGFIHGVDSILIPPPKTLKVLELLPGDFSTLLLGLGKTGLIKDLADATTTGGTFFAPSNFAFKKLGPRINAFLFSKYGEKYLKALLKYHVVANQTLYSNAYYGPAKSELRADAESDVGADTIPYYHFDLPTLLDDKALSIDVARYGPFIEIKINGFGRVAVQDGVTKDGVIQVVGDVLIPPKTGAAGVETEFWMGEEMSVEEFKERLGPFVEGVDGSAKLDL